MKHAFRSIAFSFVVLIGLAAAQSPHYINNKTGAAINSSGDLVVSFKISGLGEEVTTVTATGTLSGEWGCFTRNELHSNHPQAANKETISGEFTVSQNFTPRNGNVVGSITVSPDEPDLCPNGQVLKLVSVTYSNVQSTAAFANNETVTIASISLGTFSATLFP
jgi:hypothetical protein